VKGWCPRPLDEGDKNLFYLTNASPSKHPDTKLVEVSGIEPLTSCMPCKRSPS